MADIWPLPEDRPLYLEIIEECTYPNRKGYDAICRWRPGILRSVQPGDFDMYGRVVNWVLAGKARFVEANPLRPTMSGQVIVED